MSMNEIFAPNGPHNKMSLPVIGTVESGDPVVVGLIAGVAQTSLEVEEGGTTGVVNSNAPAPDSSNPGNVTVWNGGTWRLYVDTTDQAVEIGDPIYADLTSIASDSVVPLYSDGSTGRVLFGVAYEAAAIGLSGSDAAYIGVRVNETIGDPIASE